MCLCEEEYEEEVFPKVDKIKEKWSLVEKIYADKNVGKETIKGTMGNIWRLNKSASFTEAERNVFIVTFVTDADKQRALDGIPLLFENNHFLL